MAGGRQQGVVIRAYSGYYYVQGGNRVTPCSLRGRFKKERFTLFVGDEVVYSVASAGKGVIEEILPRRSLLSRPAVANVDQVVVTFAAASPDIHLGLVDRFLVLGERSGLDIVLCINKADLADVADINAILALYAGIGYKVVAASARTGDGLTDLRDCLSGRVTVFSGPSGVGKSTLLNAVEPGLSLVTGDLSSKISRGRHTTRFAHLLPLAAGGFVVDTPGFSLAEFADLPEAELAYCFPDIAALAPACRFSTCLHHREPQCAVKNAAARGTLADSRYRSYIDILSELKELKKGF